MSKHPVSFKDLASGELVTVVLVKNGDNVEIDDVQIVPLTGGQSRGLGDTIAKMTSAVGIRPCAGCKKRQKALNKAIPY